MSKQIHRLIGWTALSAAMSLSLFSPVKAQLSDRDRPQEPIPSMRGSRPIAQNNQTNFQGRGVVQGAAFTKGRNANVSLSINRDTFVFDLVEPPGTRARVQYRGNVVRQTNNSSNAGNFTLDGRVRTFDSSDSQRILNNTTGTCRIEVFDSRVISSSCRSASADSATQFLGLEQF